MSRFPFTVDRCGDSALISSEMGRVRRVRQMPLDTLRLVGELCRRLQDAGREERPEDSEIPFFPGYCQWADGEIVGLCHATLGFHRPEDGKVESVIAVYDHGDETCPVLILVEEEIDEFIRMT